MSGIGRRRSAAKADGAQGYSDRRNEIAEAAARVFNRKGYQATTLANVAAELGIDRASLYYYVSDKGELFDSVVRDATIRNVASARAIEASEAPPPEKLRRLIVDLMSSYSANYPLLYIYIRENLKQVADTRSEWAREMRQLNQEYENAVIAIVEQGYADGSFRDLGPARVVAYGIIGMIGWTNRWFRPETSEHAADTIGESFAAMVLGGLKA